MSNLTTSQAGTHDSVEFAAEGVYFQRIWVQDHAFDELLARKKLPTLSARGFYALGHDLASFLLAVNEVLPPQATGAQVRDVISNLHFNGLTGDVTMANFRGKELPLLRMVNGEIVTP